MKLYLPGFTTGGVFLFGYLRIFNPIKVTVDIHT